MELILLVFFIFFLGWIFQKIGTWLEGIGKEVQRREASQALYRREMLASARALEGALVPHEEPVSERLARAQRVLKERQATRKQIDELCGGRGA